MPIVKENIEKDNRKPHKNNLKTRGGTRQLHRHHGGEKQVLKRAAKSRQKSDRAEMLSRIKSLLPAKERGEVQIKHPNETLEAALRYHKNDLPCFPIKTDGSKAPAISWKDFQEKMPTEAQLIKWFDVEDPPGIGIVQGVTEKNVTETIDIDAPLLVDDYFARVKEASPELFDKLNIVKTPREDGGRHLIYYIDIEDVEKAEKYGGSEFRNQVLAYDENKQVLIETRSDGGYIIAPGSPASVHPTDKPYELLHGSLYEVTDFVTAQERELLFNIARSFNKFVDKKTADRKLLRDTQYKELDMLPGVAYNQSQPLEEIRKVLIKHGWEYFTEGAHGELLTRPGKHTGASATLYPWGMLHVFSSNAKPFEPEENYSPFAILALLEFDGDFSACAKALRKRGFGGQAQHNDAQAGQRNQSNPQPPKAESMSLPVTWLDEVEEEQVDWLMPGVPIGEVTIIDGDPKAGKSWTTFSWAAAVSNGKYPQLPGWTERQPGKVLIFSLENKSTKVIKPRLRHLNANMANIAVIDVPVVLDEDNIQKIEEAVSEVKPDLIIIDPIVAYIGGGLDMNQANKVRQPMQRLQMLAAKFKCAVVVVRHLNKGNGSKAIYRGQGSIDFVASVRSAFIAITNPENPDERALHHTACNLGKEREPLGYTIENTDDGVGILLWTGAPKFDLESALTHQKMSQDEVAVQNDAVAFLRAILRDGEQAANDIKDAAKEEGFTDKQLRTAREKLDVQIRRVGQGRNIRSYWRLPDTDSDSEKEQEQESSNVLSSFESKSAENQRDDSDEDYEPKRRSNRRAARLSSV